MVSGGPCSLCVICFEEEKIVVSTLVRIRNCTRTRKLEADIVIAQLYSIEADFVTSLLYSFETELVIELYGFWKYTYQKAYVVL